MNIKVKNIVIKQYLYQIRNEIDYQTIASIDLLYPLLELIDNRNMNNI